MGENGEEEDDTGCPQLGVMSPRLEKKGTLEEKDGFGVGYTKFKVRVAQPGGAGR